VNLINIRKGEQVLHAQHGVGRITSIRNRSFSGHAPASYVKVYFERDKLTMMVLEDDLRLIVRGLITNQEARELLVRITDWKGKPESQWKARAEANQAAIDSGDPFEYVKVLKELAQLESKGELGLCDREHLRRSLCLLTEEISSSLKKSPQRVHKLLTQAIGAAL